AAKLVEPRIVRLRRNQPADLRQRIVEAPEAVGGDGAGVPRRKRRVRERVAARRLARRGGETDELRARHVVALLQRRRIRLVPVWALARDLLKVGNTLARQGMRQ